MDNGLITEKGSWKRNWTWLYVSIACMIVTIVVLSGTDGNITDVAEAYSETTLYKEAINKAKTNKKAAACLDNIEEIGKLAILEGNVKYSKDKKSAGATIRIKGDRGKGKMDIIAYKNDTVWKIYKESAGIEITSLRKLKSFNLGNPIVKRILTEQYENKIPYGENVAAPSQSAEADELITVFDNY